MKYSSVNLLYQEELYEIKPRLLVVLPRMWHEILDTEKVLLAKILNSVKLDLSAVQIITEPQVSLEKLSQLTPERVLIFGSKTNESLSNYQNTIVNSVSVIMADDLSSLDDARKKNLWLALRQMFGI